MNKVTGTLMQVVAVFGTLGGAALLMFALDYIASGGVARP